MSEDRYLHVEHIYFQLISRFEGIEEILSFQAFGNFLEETSPLASPAELVLRFHLKGRS